ncbi:MAG: NAD-dependent succinate-semialdehyde dehydrogenase [Pseudomonadota bacterium]
MSSPALLKNQVYVNGAWQDAASGAAFPVTNPATGETIGTVPSLSAEETANVVAAANEAFSAWRQTTSKERSALLRRWHDLILANKDDLAKLVTLEQGKPLAEAAGEVVYGASFIEWFAEEAKRTYGDTIPGHQRQLRITTIKQPIGVAAAITPWNFPIAMITRKAGAALAAGCSFIVKPAEQTPLSALALAQLADEAGIPAGVFNVITGDPATLGGVLTQSDIVRKLSFTGSTPIGRLLMRQSAETVKKLSLELGGNAPFVVMDDADIDKAADAAILCKFRNAGQTCVCANRIYVQAGAYDAFTAALTERSQNLKVGDGFEDGVQIGPLIDDAAVQKVSEHLADALAKGASVTTGGKPHALGGQFFEPTVLSGATQDMLMAREETFGPLAPLIRFETEADAITLANASEFGLAAYVFTKDLGRMHRLSEGIEAGMIGVNTGIISTEVAPFGGIKQSGLGREGSHEGIDEYLETKYICTDIGE